MDNDLDLGALRAFRTVLREGSFAMAARVLHMPKSTLSKRIADLETLLGVRLIERTTRQLRATREGELLLTRAERLLSEAEDIRRALSESGGRPRGHLRIAAPPVVGNVLMGRIGAGFRAAYPEVTLEVQFFERSPDLLEEGFDGALRFGPLEDSGQIARLITHGHAMLVAAPGLPGLERIRRPQDLTGLPQISMTPNQSGHWPLTCGNQNFEVPIRPGLALGSFLAIREAAVLGAGVALMPWLLARPALRAGALVSVLPEWTSPRHGLNFVYPSAHSVTARLRAFIDHLAAEIAGMELAETDGLL